MRHWSHDSFFYHIYPLGFCGALYNNDFSSPPANRLEKLISWLGHIKDLGANALYLGPVFESSFHGYDTADYYKVDRRLGTNQLLKEIISLYRQNGIRVILDGVFNHAGRSFWAFKDVLYNRQNSPYCSWFEGLDFSSNNSYNDHLSYQGWNGHFDLVKLNLSNQEVKHHLFNAIEMWIDEFGIDGLRLDAADCVDLGFLKDLRSFVKKQREDFWLLGEVIHGDYNRWVNCQTLDSVTNYESYKGFYSSHNDRNYFEIAYTLNRQSGEGGIYKDLSLYTFADNHDVDRIASRLKNPAHLYPLYCFLFTTPGIPSVYYGSEWGSEGIRHRGSDHLLRQPLNLAEAEGSRYKGLHAAVKKLAFLRHISPSLKYGSYRELHTGHEILAFIREHNEENVVVIISSAEKPVSLTLPVSFPDGSLFRDILNEGNEYFISEGCLNINSVWPCWAIILKYTGVKRQ